MTPEEVFANLRDIHLPPVVDTASAMFDVRPLAVFAVLTVAVGLTPVIAKWRRKWALRAEIRRLEHAPPDEQRDALIRLAVQTRPLSKSPAPAILFRPPDQIGADDVAILRTWLLGRLG